MSDARDHALNVIAVLANGDPVHEDHLIALLGTAVAAARRTDEDAADRKRLAARLNAVAEAVRVGVRWQVVAVEVAELSVMLEGLADRYEEGMLGDG